MCKTVLFQGDSITDTQRIRESSISLGSGYAMLIAATLGLEHPNEYRFLNRGIGGNRIVDLYSRIKVDLINLKPDYLSILIGVNDVWHEYTKQNGVSAKKFEMVYRLYLSEIREALPDCKILLLEPFVLPGSATETTEEAPGRWEFFSKEVPLRAEATRRLAAEFSLPSVPLQPLFDKALEKAPASYWLRDGVHPTTAGHEIIKREWIKAFRQLS